mmetsp:Transcript_38645/g.96044  ORF Transcript_38645/g.96044 Transcript_38645/m.96044 type:complete len:232 (+) Transcript_38645:32-727(+)
MFAFLGCLPALHAAARHPRLSFAPTTLSRAPLALAFADDGPALTTLPSGLRYVEKAKGEGALPAVGEVIAVEYLGEIVSDGRKVVFPDAPDQLVFVRGQAPVKVWDAIVEGMRVGGKRRVFVPPSAEFQPVQSGSGAIGKGETIRFELHLTKIETGPAALLAKLSAALRKTSLTPLGLIFLLSLLPYFLPDDIKPGLWKGGPEYGLVAQIESSIEPPAAFDKNGDFEGIGF